jgi:flagellar biosynthetic protein FliR
VTCSPDFFERDVFIYLLVLARVAALVMAGGLFGPASIPLRYRAGLAMTLSFFVAPLELAKGAALPDSPADYLVLAGAEALVGLVLGLGVAVLFSAIHLAGRLISQMSGMQLADVFDPGFDTSTSAFSRLLFYVTLAVFLAVGGHRRALEALLDTFTWLPLGQAKFSQSITSAMTSVLAQSFELGIRAAAPAMVALLLATLILGLASRALPQLNLLVLGFASSAMVTFVVLGMSLGAAAWTFQDQLEPALRTVLDSLRPQ